MLCLNFLYYTCSLIFYKYKSIFFGLDETTTALVFKQ